MNNNVAFLSKPFVLAEDVDPKKTISLSNYQKGTRLEAVYTWSTAIVYSKIKICITMLIFEIIVRLKQSSYGEKEDQTMEEGVLSIYE